MSLSQDDDGRLEQQVLYGTFLKKSLVFHMDFSALNVLQLKGNAIRKIFYFFYINRFGINSLHNLSSLSDFGFEFAEIFVIKN
jgi:hypothetical protein